MYHNRHAAHPIHLEDLDAGNVRHFRLSEDLDAEYARHFRLSEDVPPMTAGWEKVPARDP